MTPNEAIASYRANYPLKPMKKNAIHADEVRQMQPADGMNELPPPPLAQPTFTRHASLPNTVELARQARHLWVIRSVDFPVALEKCLWAAQLEGRRIQHSNLTGGAPAHSGGELWFIGGERIVVNAASGRYGAESEAEFDEIVEALQRSGYEVASMGFDLDNPTIANRVLVGDPEWQSPL
jgi:hypothetical protein